ncbi:hypothetical protein D3C75_608370 [compost metagenome]
MVADNAVCEAKRKIVHRARRRHADIPITEAAWAILHATPGAGFQHFNGVSLINHAIQQARPHHSGFKFSQLNNLAQVIEVCRNTV